MADYKHGAYGTIQSVGTRVADTSRCAIVYIGTAPVHTIEGGAKNVNVPMVVNNIADARKLFGYSDEWEKYTLCEAMHVHLENKGVAPLIFINVLDPAKHKATETGTVSKTPENGRIIIPAAQDIILDTVTVKSGSTTKVKGKDYAINYNIDKKTMTIAELTSGALGSSALTITYSTIDATKVDNADVIGTTDGLGANTGLYAISSVYQMTGYIPAYIAAPGFSSVPAIHSALVKNATKINGHWDAYLFADLPIIDNETPLTLETVKTFKESSGYENENETVFFPMAQGVDGKKYHLSVLAAANFQALLLENSGIPYKTASNTECAIIENLYLGENATGRVYDDSTINEKLNKNGIASAAYVGGRWAIWGCHSADYNQDNNDSINVSETNRMMLYYLSNDFQHRRAGNVDKPMTRNDLQSIRAEEQQRLDALLNIGALTYGNVVLNAEATVGSDIMNGDFSFVFDITTTPLARSLTAIVNWTDEGFTTYYENLLA